MNKVLRVSLIVVIVLIGSVALIWTGYRFVRTAAWSGNGSFYSNMMGYGDQELRSGFGIMESGLIGGRTGSGRLGFDMMGSGAGYGMMGSGLMNGFIGNNNLEPLSVEDAREAVESYLGQFDDDDLVIEEIMIFDNNAYAIIVEESTGIGAFELLVDPQTKNVFPEYGPNMMWNLKYGMMGGAGGPGMMGGTGGFSMMDGLFNDSYSSEDITTEFRVTPEEAFDLAQDFLNRVYPGVEVSDEITMFYGYYTIDTERDGDIVGMLSVNGFTGQVFPHTWHGEFIEMVEG